MAVTIDDIAKKIGVSKTTVSRALNNKSRISEETRNSILEAAKDLNYLPNKLASGLRSKKSMAIGLIINDLVAGHFYSEIFNGIEDVAIREGYGVILGCTNGDKEREKKLINLFSERQVDGIIAAPTHDVDITCYKNLRNLGTPFIFIDKYLENIDTDVITSDDVLGATLAVDHFVSLGHKKIAILLGPEYPCSSIDKRIQGYKQVLMKNNFDYEQFIYFPQTIRNQREYGYKAIKFYLETNKEIPTAIFAVNDSLAIGAVKAIRERNMKVPEDIAIIGYNNDEITEYFDVRLSTVSLPKFEIGKRAINLLLDRINNNKNIRETNEFEFINIKPQLIIRDSCGAILK